MASLQYIQELYGDFVEQYGDRRTKVWFMVRTPIPALILVTGYLIFIKIVGPKFMENRKPYQLKSFMIAYSALQASLALTLFTLGGLYGWFNRYSWICQPYTDHPHEDVMVILAWCFYMNRFLEFIDTIIFILRKKRNQVSSLHVTHHSLVPILCWLGVLISPTGQYTFAAFINGFVHIFMYSYYMLAAMGPEYSKYIWWKIYLTKLQLAQFFTVFVHTAYSLVSDCDVPKIFAWVTLSQAVLFFGMFFNFYISAFFKDKKNKYSKLNILKVIFSMEAFKKLCEVCIPNQNVLFNDSPSENHKKNGINGFNEANGVNGVNGVNGINGENGITKRKPPVHSQ